MSLSLADAEAPLGPSDTVAVLTSGSVVRPGANATGATNVSVWPPPPPTRAPVVPNVVPPARPVTVPQAALPAGAHVGAAVSVTPAGSASASVTPVASDSPVLATTIV